METLKTSETLIEGLVASKLDLGENKCFESVLAPVAESGCIDPCNVKGFEQVSQPVPSVMGIGSHGDVPIKGISLFVELTGGVTIDGSNGLLHENKVEEVIVGHQECRVNVGDFVWAMTKNRSWWPGTVCDASGAPKVQLTREDGVLVRCFGNGSYIWCLPNQLKPFVGYFEEFSKQSNSKSFIGAIEKAVAELGCRVKTEFTCSCFSTTMVERRGDLSVTRFEPATFLKYIKDLARDVSMPSRIDCVVNQNCLSAFYHSLGHCQISIHQLKDVSFVMGDDIKSSNEKGEKHYETRDRRRKSRYLSYPFTDLNSGPKGSSPVAGEHGTEELKVDGNKVVDLNKTNDQPVKKPRKKWCRKSVTKHDLKKGVQENVCSSEVLFELQSAAQDCLFPIESKKFDSVEQFILEFRKRTFNDFASEITIKQKRDEILPGIGVQEMGVTGKGNRGRPKKVRNKKNQSVPLPTLGNNSNHGSVIIDFQNLGSLGLETQSMSSSNKKMEVVADQGLQNNKVIEPVSDSNGQLTILNFGNLPVTESSSPPCKLVPKRRKTNVESNTNINMLSWNSNVSGLPNTNGQIDPFLVHAIPQKNEFHLTNEVGSAPPFFTGNHGEPQVAVGLGSAGVNHEPKKRGRKRKTMDLQTNAGLIITPDLTESGVEKKKGKRVKKKQETGVPCIDLSYIKVNQDNEELKGTAFLLKFSSDHPLPSKQDLNSVFCKYGALNESETQILNENFSGQVVFLDSSSAGEAFWGLQKDHPFGQALVNYRIQHLPGAESTIVFKTPIKSPSGLKPLQQGENLDSQVIVRPTVIPDLNGSHLENKLMKRSYSKVQQGSGEVTGTYLLLKFSPNHPLPSNQDLNSVFCKYGELNEFETRVSSQTLTGQVVFVNPSTVSEAIQNLEKDRPFGQALVSYRVQNLYNGESAIRFKNVINVIPLELKPPQQGEAADLAVIKKNLEMMTRMLEKGGGGLSMEMRVKLESEIKGLVKKVSTMDGCSSSSA